MEKARFVKERYVARKASFASLIRKEEPELAEAFLSYTRRMVR